MNRLINADALKEAFAEDGHLSGYIEEFIDDCPTVDAVPVVRCRDCKHYEDPELKIFESCVRDGRCIPMKPYDFCSYGERRSGDAKR